MNIYFMSPCLGHTLHVILCVCVCVNVRVCMGSVSNYMRSQHTASSSKHELLGTRPLVRHFSLSLHLDNVTALSGSHQVNESPPLLYHASATWVAVILIANHQNSPPHPQYKTLGVKTAHATVAYCSCIMPSAN